MLRVLLLGLEDDAARRIESILTDAGHQVRREYFRSRFPVAPQADAIFLWGDHRDYKKAVAALRAHAEKPPVIVATRLPDSAGWIDSSEEGVAGYCVAPFDSHHVLLTLAAAIPQQPAPPRGKTASA
jgi:DNA-binding response OmpR family regulator